MKTRNGSSENEISVDFKVGAIFDAKPLFKTNALFDKGRLIRPRCWGLYLTDSKTGATATGLVKGMPVEYYNRQNEIPLIIRGVLLENKNGQKNIIYLEPRLEIDDMICVKPELNSKGKDRKNWFYTRFFLMICLLENILQMIEYFI